MELNTKNENVLFKLNSKHSGVETKGSVLSSGRILVGRAESCEMIISSSGVSSVHAVIEISGVGAKVYDMNSKNGTFINGEKIVSNNLNIGDSIRFGDSEFIFEQYSTTSQYQVLDALEPSSGVASTHNTLPSFPVSLDEKEQAPSIDKIKVNEDVPYVAYPLEKDPKAEFSEYIFEDADQLHPIFKYEHSKQSVEIIILFKDIVYSVDYLDSKDGTYSLVGSLPKKDQVEFSYLGKDEKVAFVEIKSGNCIVNKLHNYEVTHISNEGASKGIDSFINIQDQDVVKFENGDLEIYVRKVSAPPKVKSPPFFRRDKEFWKYILIVLSFVTVVSLGVSLYSVPEVEKEKDPDRIARILYKQPLVISKNKAVEKTEKAPPKKQTTPKKVIKTKPKVAKKAPAKKPKVVKPKVTKAGTKAATKVQKVKKVTKAAPKVKAPSKLKTTSAASKSVKTAQTRKANRPSPNKGAIDVYKSVDFRSTVSALAAKGGSLRGATTATSSKTGTSGASIGGGVATNVKKANIGNEVGSLSGSASGKLAESKGTAGLSANTGTYAAGIPSETMVLGSMDPDVIRRILRENIPQFRYCYQKELDRRGGNKVSGTVGLLFTIGASGHVSKAGVNGGNLPTSVKGCVVRVLRGIKFPRPMGGGTVDVKQPFNFYPENI